MQIQINSDSSIEGDIVMTQQLESIVRDSLRRFSEHVTRVRVHVSDENSDTKSGSNDKRCMVEVRLVGHQPTVTIDQAPTLEQAVQGAAEKMKRSLETTVGRLGNR